MNYTSLCNSMLFLSTMPFMCMLHMLIKGQKPSSMESMGAIVAFAGVAVVAFGSHFGGKDGLFGDFLALLAGVFGYVWLHYDNYFMQELKVNIFVYYFPFAVVSASMCVILSCLTEGMTFVGLMTGFVETDPVLVFFLGLGPGVLGLVLMTYCQSHVNILAVSIIQTLEPLFGSLVATLLSVQNDITLWTLCGGTVMILGNCLAIYGHEKARVAKSKAENEEFLLAHCNAA
mmetsp:Transcript_43352/g.49858  ORF Transcript_43352/g.49858 Transcript_43352/m.49858 type:complete len:231 (+) Transcript_43352:550-1242(+)